MPFFRHDSCSSLVTRLTTWQQEIQVLFAPPCISCSSLRCRMPRTHCQAFTQLLPPVSACALPTPVEVPPLAAPAVPAPAHRSAIATRDDAVAARAVAVRRARLTLSVPPTPPSPAPTAVAAAQHDIESLLSEAQKAIARARVIDNVPVSGMDQGLLEREGGLSWRALERCN